MYKKSISVAVALCFLGMGSFAFGASFGGPESFQADWGATWATCKPAVPPLTKDWYDVDNWGLQNNGNNGCGCPFMTGSYYFMAIEAVSPEPWVSTTSFYWPGIDANGYDSYATQIFIMPWTWEYAPAGFRVTMESGNINAGRMIALAYNVEWPASWNTYPILNVNGGTIYTPGYRNFDANECWDPCKFDDPAYPWYVGDGLWVGGGGSGNGENFGIVNIRNSGKIIVPRVRLYNGEINIFPDGLLYDTNSNPDYFFISRYRSRNRINVAGGELRLAGDRRDQIAYYVSNNLIVPYGRRGDLIIDYNGFDTSVTAISTPDSAWNPNPIDGAVAVPLNKVLSWSAGPSTQPPGFGNAHDVYFGTDYIEVTDATTSSSVFKGAQDALSYDPGALVMDTDYFWRVDERNGVTVWKGNIWMFKTKGPQATDPIPADDAVGLPIPIVLKWNPGNKASGPTAHAVFFGPNETDVTDASISNPLGCFKGYVTDPVYDLGSLDFDLAANTDYYWRIDESNGIDVWKGEVWQVTNTNYFVIEDFESYTDNASMQLNWKMGSVDYTPCGPNNSNGVIDFDFNDSDNKHMQYDYNDAVGMQFSEVRLDVNNVDWTGGGVLPDNNKLRSLSISFIGNTNNDADPVYDRMYAAIEDTAGNFEAILNSDSQAQRSFGWTQWYINLRDLNDTNNVKLANIKYLYIGFGDRCHGYVDAGGTGRIRIDDIRLYQRTCNSLFLPVGDLSGDCKVDLADIDVMANAWLAKAIVISPVTNPGTTGLRLWYQFNETTGITVADSSGNGYDGEVNSNPTFADGGQDTAILWDATGGYDGSGCFLSSALAISDFNMSIEADGNALDANGTSLTLSIWVNGDTYMPLSCRSRIICAFQNMNTNSDDDNEVLEIQCPIPRAGTSSTTHFRIGVLGVSDEVSSAGMPLSAFAGSWQHYAFVRDGVANKIRIYHNGEMIADADALNPLFTPNVPFESFRLISRNQVSGSWYGKIDDFRVYNRALSDAEIGWLGTKGTGNVPFSNTSNFKSSTPEKISFNDMAMLAKNWLTVQLWPNP